ncbi:MAG: hypothetical protein J7L82_00050 [Staphylothermus sp.]|nr:hypothetical protein [Staphylothermus sp.]
MDREVNYTVWRKRKIEFWNRIWEDLEIGYLDKDLLGLLVLFNMDKNIHTLSSCSGRIVIADSTYPWSREETSVVFKKHLPITTEELIEVLTKPSVRRMWINVTGPIIHLSTTSFDYGLKILTLAREAGFKHSGILSFNTDKGYVLELTTGVRLSNLLKEGNKIYINEKQLENFVAIINEVLIHGKKLLLRLYNTAKKVVPIHEDEEIMKFIEDKGIDTESINPWKILSQYINQITYNI